MVRKLVLPVLLMLAASCSPTDSEQREQHERVIPSITPTEDPYTVYLELAPAGAVELSREDAQLRALLGCAVDWAPGTVDAALAEAYAYLCAQTEKTEARATR